MNKPKTSFFSAIEIGHDNRTRTTKLCFSTHHHLKECDEDGYCIYCGTQDLQVYLFSFNYCDCNKVEDSQIGEVELALYQDVSGGLFAIDTSYIEQEAGPCFNPFTGKEFEPK